MFPALPEHRARRQLGASSLASPTRREALPVRFHVGPEAHREAVRALWGLALSLCHPEERFGTTFSCGWAGRGPLRPVPRLPLGAAPLRAA